MAGPDVVSTRTAAPDTLAASESDGPGARLWRRRDRQVVAAAVIMTVLPLLVAVPRVLSKGAVALHGDDALIELRVRDVGSHTPLVGSYQRFGYNQPGPALFYLLVAPYRLLGSRFAGLQVAALLTNAAAVVGIAAVAFRRGGTVLALWSLTLVAVLAHALGATKLSDPWEPHITVLPLVLLLILAADVASGRAGGLPMVAALASFLAQSYAVLAPLAAALFAWAVVSVVLRAWRRSRRPSETAPAPSSPWERWRTVTVATVAVLGVLWLAPLVEQLSEQPGNVTQMVDFFSTPNETLGVGGAYHAVALQFDHRAPWLGNDLHFVPFTTEVDIRRSFVLPLALVALIAAIAFGFRRRTDATAFGLTVLFAVGAGILGLSRLVGDVYPWILESTRVLGLGCWLAAGWCAYRVLGTDQRDRLARLLVPALSAAVLVLGAVNVVDAATGSGSPDPGRDAVMRLSEPAVRAARDAGGPVLVRSTADVSAVFGEGRFGEEQLVLALERAGVDVLVDSGLGHRYGDHRAHPERAVRELRLVTRTPPSAATGFDVVATADITTPAQRRDKDRLGDAIRDRVGERSLPELRDAMDEDPELRDLVERFNAIEDAPALTLLVRDLP
jgi:hypothetical protein